MNSIRIKLSQPVKNVKVASSRTERMGTISRSAPASDYTRSDQDLQKELQKAYQRGFNDGVQAEKKKAEQVKKEILQQLRPILDALIEQSRQLDQQIATAIYHMAVKVAYRLLGMELMTNADALEKVIYDAIKEAGDTRKITILLHPDDIELLRKIDSSLLTSDNVNIQSSLNMERGGCVVETDTGIIDAQLSTRIEEYQHYLESQEIK